MSKDNILPVLREESEKLYIANKQKNKFAGEEREHQQELDYLLADLYEGKEGSFEHSFQYNDKQVNIEVSYDQKVTDTADVKKFFGVIAGSHVPSPELAKPGYLLVPEDGLELFLNTVTVSKSAIETVAGKNVANRCVTSKLSDFKTWLKEKK